MATCNMFSVQHFSKQRNGGFHLLESAQFADRESAVTSAQSRRCGASGSVALRVDMDVPAYGLRAVEVLAWSGEVPASYLDALRDIEANVRVGR